MTHALASLLLVAAGFAGQAESPDVAVVAAPALRGALAPWAEHRTRQGHRLAWIDTAGEVEVIRRRLQEVNRDGSLKYVVLVGDVPGSSKVSRAIGVPTTLAKAVVNVHWGSEPELATDHPYGDLDADGVPELAVGRLSVDSPEELERLIARILAYEQTADDGPWRRRIELVAGVGGFGAIADTALEMVTRRFLTDRVPASYETRMTYASWRSPYCPDPRAFRSEVINGIRGGSLFWVYIGHGSRRHLDAVNTPVGSFPILHCDDAPQLTAGGTPPIAVFLACYTGAFDLEDDCLAEMLMEQPGGPIAAMSGSRVTMPYAMAVMTSGLMDEYFVGRSATLGEAMLGAKRALLADPREDPQRELVEVLARTVSPRPEEMPAERKEHVLLFNLLGDPLLRLPQPEPLELSAAAECRAGEVLRIRLAGPVAGRGVVELVARRDQSKNEVSGRSRFDATAERLAEYSEQHKLANDRTWARWAVELGSEPLECEIEIPAEARGYCYLRAHVAGGEHGALGGREIFIRSRGAE